nr:efflux RND transporter periplasmic adaptor subunit [Desulfobulbaceae bacterium]
IHATFPGVVIAANEIQVASRMMGYVRKLPVHEGQKVKKGELLLSLDPSEVRGGIDQAKAALLKAESVLAEAKSNHERFQALYEQKAVPEQQFQQVEMGYQVAKGNYAAATAALQQAHSQLTYVEVRAPFTGTIVAKFIDIGQLAAPGRPLLTLQSSGLLQVQVQVNQQAFVQLQVGQSIPVTLDRSNFELRTVTAMVARLVDAADPMTHTHTVKLSLPEDSGANSGDYARVSIKVGLQQGIVVPRSAVQRRAGIDGVFVVDAAGRAAFRMVRLGEQNDSGVVILAGLVADDQVIIRAEGKLSNGVKVQPTQGNGA